MMLKFEKSSNMPKKLAKHEEKPCSTFDLNLFLADSRYLKMKTKIRIWVHDPFITSMSK